MRYPVLDLLLGAEHARKAELAGVRVQVEEAGVWLLGHHAVHELVLQQASIIYRQKSRETTWQSAMTSGQRLLLHRRPWPGLATTESQQVSSLTACPDGTQTVKSAARERCA